MRLQMVGFIHVQDAKNETKRIGLFPIGRGGVSGYKLLGHNKSCCQKV